MPTVHVLDSTMHYQDTGAGSPLVFLHGNPTSSHLWRGVLPAITSPGRLLAPDLIGMGRSGKPPVRYTFDDHARYLDAWIDALELDEVVLIGHDWGGALAFDWAARHPGRTRGLAFMETIVRPMSWADLSPGARDLFRSFRTPGVGEDMILDQNTFIERALPGTVLTGLGEADLAAYQAPYPTRESRLPLLQWPRQLPLDGEPREVVRRVEAYGRWLADSSGVPKLLLAFDPGPGILIGEEAVRWCMRNVSGLEVLRCGPAGHQAPEDQPAAIAAAISAWVSRNRPHGEPGDGAVPRRTSGAGQRNGGPE